MTGKAVLVVGSGGREHALAWKLRQSPDVGALYVAPGNAGTALAAENVPVSATDLAGLARFVEERDVDLTVVGPEAPLALGLADMLRSAGRRVVGPGAAAARIEASKAFAKDLMTRAGVPTAAYRVFDQPEPALRYLDGASYPVVVKADGLAAGKGVSVCADAGEARAAVRAMMVEGAFGAAGGRVVVEEALSGPEVSLLALVDGEQVVPLPLAQDHKRLGEGDTGPNTGGMGAYAPVPFVDAAQVGLLTKAIMEPVVAALAASGAPYQGVLYAGLMLTERGPMVLEFNCRFGDPEAQVLLPLIDGDLLPWLEMAAGGERMHQAPAGSVPVLDGYAVGVVLAAPGYPEKPRLGTQVEGLDAVPAGVEVFHAGTASSAQGGVVTAGGRVLTVVGTGHSVEEAARRAYAAPVRFEGMQYRRDIGWQCRSLHPVPAGYAARPLDGRPRPAYGGEDSTSPRSTRPRSRIAVLAAGEGSNLQALLEACRDGWVDAEVALVVSHRPDARALERARKAGVPAYALPLAVSGRKDENARRQHEEELLHLLREYDPDLIVLAGWMLILSKDFLARCSCPLVNIHPALLPLQGAGPSVTVPRAAPDGPLEIPALRGAHAVRDALAQGLPLTGVTVHYVTPEVDAGPVVLREMVAIEPGDDESSLYGRIKAVEHRLLPQAVQTVLSVSHVGGVYA